VAENKREFGGNSSGCHPLAKVLPNSVGSQKTADALVRQPLNDRGSLAETKERQESKELGCIPF
jgi:hypothetical protein